MALLHRKSISNKGELSWKLDSYSEVGHVPGISFPWGLRCSYLPGEDFNEKMPRRVVPRARATPGAAGSGRRSVVARPLFALARNGGPILPFLYRSQSSRSFHLWACIRTRRVVFMFVTQLETGMHGSPSPRPARQRAECVAKHLERMKGKATDCRRPGAGVKREREAHRERRLR